MLVMSSGAPQVLAGDLHGAMASAATAAARKRPVIETRVTTSTTPVKKTSASSPAQPAAQPVAAAQPAPRPDVAAAAPTPIMAPAVVPEAVPVRPTLHETPRPAANEPKQSTSGDGTLVALAMGASCSFSIDGRAAGTGSSARATVAAGTHTVTCRPAAGGSSRSRSVEVGPGEVKTALFKF
jgi:hypothetical protein